MADNSAKPSEAEIKPEVEDTAADVRSKPAGGGGGWGGWGFSYLTDLQKAATVAAGEISRNAVEVARTAAQSITDTMAEEPKSENEYGTKSSLVVDESDEEVDERHKRALDKLEKASEETFLSQGLKALDTSVESLTTGAWQALGTAWKGGANLVNKIENSASNFSESIQHGGVAGPTGTVTPSLLETGKVLTAKGMQVLELVGKEAMDLLISETGIEVDKHTKLSEGKIDEGQLFEEVTFDRCFYIYGGPEQLEELEAFSNHYALLYSRRKGKLSSEQKFNYDGKLKDIQHIFDLGVGLDGNHNEFEKGKKIEDGNNDSIDELKNLHESSVRKAAELAAGFASALAGLAPNDIIQRTSGRLDSLHSEGVHRLSEMCCSAVTQLLMLGKSVISNANKVQDQEISEETGKKIDWPEDSVERAKIIRMRTESMTGNIEAVFHSFVTGISDVAEAYLAAIKSATADSQEVVPKNSIQQKASAFTEHLRADHSTAVGKMQDGLQYLAYVVLSTSMPAA